MKKLSVVLTTIFLVTSLTGCMSDKEKAAMNAFQYAEMEQAALQAKGYLVYNLHCWKDVGQTSTTFYCEGQYLSGDGYKQREVIMH